MNNYYLKNDLKVFYTTAKSFPDGIDDAFGLLASKVTDAEKRAIVGFSCPNEQGEIIYNAAMVEGFHGEGSQYGFDTFIIPSGEYITETITQWRSKAASVEHTFRKLVRHPQATCPCVELYEGDNMICMVKVG